MSNLESIKGLREYARNLADGTVDSIDPKIVAQFIQAHANMIESEVTSREASRVNPPVKTRKVSRKRKASIPTKWPAYTVDEDDGTYRAYYGVDAWEFFKRSSERRVFAKDLPKDVEFADEYADWDV